MHTTNYDQFGYPIPVNWNTNSCKCAYCLEALKHLTKQLLKQKQEEEAARILLGPECNCGSRWHSGERRITDCPAGIHCRNRTVITNCYYYRNQQPEIRNMDISLFQDRLKPMMTGCTTVILQRYEGQHCWQTKPDARSTYRVFP